MEWCRGQMPQVNKLKFRENYKKNIDDAYRTRWSGQGCINKQIISNIVVHILKKSRLVGVGIFAI